MSVRAWSRAAAGCFVSTAPLAVVYEGKGYLVTQCIKLHSKLQPSKIWAKSQQTRVVWEQRQRAPGVERFWIYPVNVEVWYCLVDVNKYFLNLTLQTRSFWLCAWEQDNLWFHLYSVCGPQSGHYRHGNCRLLHTGNGAVCSVCKPSEILDWTFGEVWSRSKLKDMGRNYCCLWHTMMCDVTPWPVSLVMTSRSRYRRGPAAAGAVLQCCRARVCSVCSNCPVTRARRRPGADLQLIT